MPSARLARSGPTLTRRKTDARGSSGFRNDTRRCDLWITTAAHDLDPAPWTIVTAWAPHLELGLVTRAEAHADGLTDRAIRWRLNSDRWQRLYPGVYATHPGPLGWLTRASGAVLACGAGSVLADRSAAYVHHLVSDPGSPIWVVVPESRRVLAPSGVRLRRARHAHSRGSLWPPRTTIEATVVDLAVAASADDIAASLASCLQRRLTTADRLLTELSGRARHPQRSLISGMLSDIRDGVESTLELRFVRGALRPHRLPVGEAQLPLATIHPDLGGARADRDYRLLRLLIELDGVRHHQGATLVADRRKSNVTTALGWVSVRYGWTETVDRSCATATELARLFWARGWTRDSPGLLAGLPSQCPG